jgi:LacI family transcriptional regulator
MAKIRKVVLLIETSRAYGRALLRGITKYSRLHGPWVFYSEPGGLAKALPKLKRWDADGIIMRDSGKGGVVVTMGIPIIVSVHLKEHIKGTPYIDTNGVEIGRMAAEHLLERGFRHFGFCGFDKLHWSRERCKNFSKRIAEAGLKTHIYKQPKLLHQREWQNEQVLMVDWLKSLPKPVGVMACNDDRGRQLTEACKMVGLNVPEKVAIIGVDNDDLVCELSDPPLSSVALNVERGGYEAAELLDKMMSGKKAANEDIIVQPTHAVTRQSTDILAIEDSEVAAAIRFIRQHSREIIQVSDVVEAAGVSRRALQQRFKRTMGHSIYDEIKRCRIEQIATMLVETRLSISQIASAFGYPGVEKLTRYFQREKRLTPLAYRKQYSHR